MLDAQSDFFAQIEAILIWRPNQDLDEHSSPPRVGLSLWSVLTVFQSLARQRPARRVRANVLCSRLAHGHLRVSTPY
jgi:hypothetical protein